MYLSQSLTMLLPLFLVLSRARETQPNIVLVMLDEIPFLDQWKESAPADLVDVLDAIYPTPHIDAFRNEAVIFPKAYCGGPKCAPSRYSLLTGRQPSRCGYIETFESQEYGGPSVNGPEVSISSIKMMDHDGINSIPYILRNDATTPYYTGMIGKWHLQRKPGCARLDWEADADLYSECTDLVKDMGFDYVDAWFHGNIYDDNEYFSHNPEWMVERAGHFMADAQKMHKPFFMYFASTLAHSPTVDQTLTVYDYLETPMGRLDYIPGDSTTMWSRTELWNWVLDQGLGDDHEVIRMYATYAWVDQMVGALFDQMKDLDVFDDTFIVLTNDHGMEAKGMLYQKGSRIFNFVRYPKMFGTDGPMLLPADFVVSNVDIAATVFDLAGVTPPADYITDGKSYLTDVSNAINHPGEFTQTSSIYKFIDMYQSHSIVTGHLQYIYRTTNKTDAMDFGADESPTEMYPGVYDFEQMYDIDTDPYQQNNIICQKDDDGEWVYPCDEALMDQYSSDIAEMQSRMRIYITDICQMAEGDEACLMPAQLYEVAPVVSCCYPTDLTNKHADDCYALGDDEHACGEKRQWSCHYGTGDVCEAEDAPVTDCCFVTNNQCKVDDDETACHRKHCEWRSGDGADCTAEESVPAQPTHAGHEDHGCCFGTHAKCHVDDEVDCTTHEALRAGCEWRSGDDPALCDATHNVAVLPGCCVGSNRKCHVDDEAECLSASVNVHGGCEWVASPESADECLSADEDEEQVLSVAVNSMLERVDGATASWMVVMAVLVVAVLLVRMACVERGHGKKVSVVSVASYGSAGERV